VLVNNEAANTNFIVFGLNRQGLKLNIYCIWGEHANHNIADAAMWKSESNFQENNHKNMKVISIRLRCLALTLLL
jgi:hypothetical protein